jgi:NAD-dependent SIR2 family protein deacetylase
LSWSLYVSYFYEPIAKAKPNKGHEAIFELENYNKNVCVITQNVDGLHQSKFENFKKEKEQVQQQCMKYFFI